MVYSIGSPTSQSVHTEMYSLKNTCINHVRIYHELISTTWNHFVQHSLQSISYVFDVLSKKFLMLSAQQFLCIFLNICVKHMNWMRLVLYKQLCHAESRSLYRHQSFRPVFKRTVSSFFCSGLVNQFIINVDRRSVNQLYAPRGYARSS